MTSGSCRLNILLDLGSWQGVWARLWGNKRNGKALTSAQPPPMGAGGGGCLGSKRVGADAAGSLDS